MLVVKKRELVELSVEPAPLFDHMIPELYYASVGPVPSADMT